MRTNLANLAMRRARGDFALPFCVAHLDGFSDAWVTICASDPLSNFVFHLLCEIARPVRRCRLQYLFGIGSKPWFLIRVSSSWEISQSMESPLPVRRFLAPIR